MSELRIDARSARLAILGFASCQGFLYAILFVGSGFWGVEPHDVRYDVVLSLLFLVASFAAIYASRRIRDLTSAGSRLLNAAAVLPVAGLVLEIVCFAVAPAFDVSSGHLVIEALAAACSGLPAGIVLCAWGRSLGRASIAQSVPVVFIGSALGAAFSFVVSALPILFATCVLELLLIPSVLLLKNFGAADGVSCATSCTVAVREDDFADRGGKEASRLSGRILAGTCVFGVSAGLIESVSSFAGTGNPSSPSFVLLLFVVFCLAAIQLFGSSPVFSMRKILPVRDVAVSSGESGPLDGAYRLAILLMLAGYFLAPVLRTVGVSGESVVLAGFMGLTTVLVSLFLVMGRIGAHGSARTFAQGFLVLFAGEIAGVAVGGLVIAAGVAGSLSVVSALSGVAALYGYLYLFTDKELAGLSSVVDETDHFEEACTRIVSEFALSKREAEILPFALRGRTSERIASEFFITKNTVDTHMRRIYAKCGVHSRQELIDLGEAVEKSVMSR